MRTAENIGPDLSQLRPIMVLCFGRDLFPRVSLREDLHTNSTHCMQIIFKTRFQFPHWVMKKVLFLKVITIFKLIYLL